ncbi:hypothetical protein LTR15_009481 [Elasticomyces elasticus]|nr:hypothetical protein LTR15_009481 [Elasticomyces elasticus]
MVHTMKNNKRMRTGATELQHRLPVHLATALRCYPNYVIFSDHEEVYEGEHILDALADVSPDIRANHKDFQLYRRLKSGGRASLATTELSGPDSRAAQWIGNAENEGWKLDKWKFLPMVNRTFHEYPAMKWYVFVEADTYIMWASMLQYLSALDATKPHYTGSQMYIANVQFAHGGSGFMVSQPAMRLVVERYAAYKAEIEAFTDGHWAGDCVLGKAFTDAGVPFTDAWPIMQGDYPGIVAYAQPDGRPIADANKRVWCYPTVSYHHLSPTLVEDLWTFEQQWIAFQHSHGEGILHHKDMFRQYIVPRMSVIRNDWDNESDEETDNGGVVQSAEACRALCESRAGCRQYAFHGSGICKLRTDPRLGKVTAGVSSGWLRDRLLQFEQSMASCGNEGWLIPQ